MDQMTDGNLQELHDVLSCVIDQPAQGRFQVARRMFADPTIFELEMRHIFEASWVYVAHESQLPNPHDYFATQIGRQPVLLLRGEDGALRCVYNSCSHRGALLTSRKRGNQKTLMCAYHGWVYDSSGRCVAVDNEERGAYPPAFANESHDLVQVARLESYRGFVFASLSAEVPPLREYLSGATALIDTLADQSPDGLEVLKGGIHYTCDSNWKMQLENIDGYHFFPVHASYIGVVMERMKAGGGDKVKAIDASQLASIPGGNYDLGNGHIVDWAIMPNGDDRPLAFQRERINDEFGQTQAQWMIDAIRNLAVYPNLLLMDQSSTTIRVVRPLSVDRTQMEVYCVAPRGEPAAARTRRVRQFEDFLGPAGMATPDDQRVMELCQLGFAARDLGMLQGHYRGTGRLVQGPDEQARRVGLDVVSSGPDIDDETFAHAQYREWARLMARGLESADG